MTPVEVLAAAADVLVLPESELAGRVDVPADVRTLAPERRVPLAGWLAAYADLDGWMDPESIPAWDEALEFARQVLGVDAEVTA